MVPSVEQIQTLANTIDTWRMQEYIDGTFPSAGIYLKVDRGIVSFHSLYVYYVFTTVADEVRIIAPQRWSRGKMLFTTIRYGTIAFIALQLSRDYRNYFSISPMACKMLHIAYDFIYRTVYLACDFSLALCLSALLQAKTMYFVGIVILSCGMPLVNSAISLIGYIQYPAEPVSLLDTELGYPCYSLSSESWMKRTVAYLGLDIRAYLNLVATTILAILGVATLVARYNEQGGRLVQVIRRDSGIHYLSLLVIRMATAIVRTPAVMVVQEFNASPVRLVIGMANLVVIPILAQRLLVNMRKVDYMSSEPIASKLLFAPPAPGSEDDLEGDFGSLEMTRGRQEPSGQRQRGSAGEGSEMGEADVRDSGV